jgi:hypothetical protein
VHHLLGEEGVSRGPPGDQICDRDYRRVCAQQYALEKLGESGEADAVRSRHRDFYESMAALLDAPARTDYQQRLDQMEVEMDNLRSAMGWSLENSDTERALSLASSLQPLWMTRGRLLEGRAWFDAVLAEADPENVEVPPAVRIRALADTAALNIYGGGSTDQAERALAIARELDDPALLARALTACGVVAGLRYDAEAARTHYSEASVLARKLDDRWSLRPAKKVAISPTRLVTGPTRGCAGCASRGCN